MQEQPHLLVRLVLRIQDVAGAGLSAYQDSGICSGAPLLSASPRID